MFSHSVRRRNALSGLLGTELAPWTLLLPMRGMHIITPTKERTQYTCASLRHISTVLMLPLR